jgi:hypothetical protein
VCGGLEALLQAMDKHRVGAGGAAPHALAKSFNSPNSTHSFHSNALEKLC